MRHVIILASRYWESKINYLVTDRRICKRIDVKRGVNQVQLFVKIEPEDHIVLGNVHVDATTAIQRVNLSEVAPAPRVYVPKLLKALNRVAIQRILDFVVFVEDQNVRILLAVPADSFTLKLKRDRRLTSQEPKFPP